MIGKPCADSILCVLILQVSLEQLRQCCCAPSPWSRPGWSTQPMTQLSLATSELLFFGTHMDSSVTCRHDLPFLNSIADIVLCRNTGHALLSIAQREGPRGLFKGLLPTILTNAPFSGTASTLLMFTATMPSRLQHCWPINYQAPAGQVLLHTSSGSVQRTSKVAIPGYLQGSTTCSTRSSRFSCRVKGDPKQWSTSAQGPLQPWQLPCSPSQQMWCAPACSWGWGV
jgi:hypothetical protein